MFKNIVVLLFSLLLISAISKGQNADTTKSERFSVHSQTTVIWQYKPSFGALYSGVNSLNHQEENETSITSTLFAGLKLWRGAGVYVNPELAGGSGLSGALGVAASTNGETYRIGNPKPRITASRYYFRQLFYKNDNLRFISSDINRLAGMYPQKYIGLTIGKISVADFFDNNIFSHDPRTQFLSWGLMSNGAWDYPANTFGYTPGVVLEWVNKNHELRYAFSLMPVSANGTDMDWHINKANSQTLEYTYHYKLIIWKGSIRLLSFFNNARMGNYNNSIDLNPKSPDIIQTREYGHTKYGFCLNIEQSISRDAGCFIRAGWNDGNNETWVFTEIDHTLSMGFSGNMRIFGRIDDRWGMAFVSSGLSKPHRNYLEHGGNGFILGDGRLNYSIEQLGEIYYSIALEKDKMYSSVAYQ